MSQQAVPTGRLFHGCATPMRSTVILPTFRDSLLGCPGPTTNTLHHSGCYDVVPTHQI